MKAKPSRQQMPTLDDVARRAGVSTATVSRFHNSPGVVAHSTAARIRAAIAATGYVPNLLAGGLASRRSRLVAVLVPEIAPSVFNDTIEAMTKELSVDGNVVMLGLTGPGNERMPELIEAALARRADGIILTGVVTDAAMRARLREHGTTVIETWGIPDDPIDIAVGFSHGAVGRDLARFLHGRGFERPLLTVSMGLRAQQRRDGFVEEWTASGHKPPGFIDVPMPIRFGHARQAWRQVTRLKKMPDVIVCGSDLLAQGFIIEAQAAGLRVPEDVAVTGFGNLAVAGDMRPSITTVDVDGARIGREAVAVLRRRSAGEKVPRHTIDVGFRLIARESA